MNHTKKQGYILVLTMVMMAALSALIVYIFNRGMTAIPLVAIILDKEKAKLLCMSGVEVTRSLIAGPQEAKETTKDTAQESGAQEAAQVGQDAQAEKAKQQSPELAYLQSLLPRMNRWSEFVLRQQIDGVDGILKICITCEDGKINLNKIYDFKTRKFMGEGFGGGNWKVMVDLLLKNIEKSMGVAGLFDALEFFLKAQKGPIDDVSPLLKTSAFAVFRDRLFLQPPAAGQKDVPPTIALTDLFTAHGTTAALEPWLLSASLLYACNLPYDGTVSVEERTKSVAQWTKYFKPTTSWRSDWSNTGKLLYQKEFAALPKGVDAFFASTFKPTMFGVLVEATVGRATQKMYAIVERTRHSHNNQIVYDSVVRKWYIV